MKIMSDDIEDDILSDVEVLIDFEHTLTIIRLIENTLIPSTLRIKAEVLPGLIEVESDFDIAFAKIRFWFENVVSRSIAFCRDNDAAMDMLTSDAGKNVTGNNLMLTPEEPTDAHLAAIFQAKMSALANGVLGFGTVEIRSDNVVGLMFTFVGEAEEVLPTMDEWIGKRTYFDAPWWLRDDASTLDVVPPEDADLKAIPDWAFSLDFIEKSYRPKQEFVVRPEFKPVIIDGGKSDKDE